VTVVVAHRGASKAERENTMDAFLVATELGADWIELDVRRTSDEVLVVHHDAHLHDGRALVDTLAADLPDHIPSLAEVLDRCSDVGVNIEIKNDPGDPDYDAEHQISAAVAGLCAAYRTPNDVMISSFNIDALSRIQAIDSTWPVALVVFDVLDPAQLLERSTARGHAAVNPYTAIADRRFVERAHEVGLAVNVWTVNEPDVVARLVELGVDGVITDDPAMARRVIDEAAVD